MTAGRGRGDAGQVGGIEAVPLGLLVFVVGALLIANAWAVVDARFATDAAAREAVRTYVEAPGDHPDPIALARAAGLEALAGHGRDPERATLDPVAAGELLRCRRVAFEATYQVPALTLPWIGGYGQGPFTVRSRASQIIDPFRSGLAGEAGACR